MSPLLEVEGLVTCRFEPQSLGFQAQLVHGALIKYKETEHLDSGRTFK